MKYVITNAFSIAMLPEQRSVTVRFIKMSDEEAQNEIIGCEIKSAMGHPDIAAIASDRLGIYLHVNRINVRLSDTDGLIVAQYIGPRLPEGARTLPDGARIDFYAVYASER